MRNTKIIISLLTAVLIVITTFALVFQTQVVPFSVSLMCNGQTEKIDCWKNGEDEYYVFLPSYADLSNVCICLNTEKSVSINGKRLVDGMSCEGFEFNVSYDFSCSNLWNTYESSITFLRSDGMATMHIDTQSGSMDYIHSKKGNKESGVIRLYTENGTLDYKGDVESISGRGNFTWDGYDKKPYSLSLFDEADLLGMGKAQRWILLANSADPLNIRNKSVYDFAAAVGLAYSPDTQWVDLYLNGEYAGLYLLSERNEVHTDRVDISTTDSFLVSLELEKRLEAQGHTFVSTKSGQALRVHYPQTISNESLNELAKKWQSVENAILAEDGVDYISGKNWTELIDLDSWAKKYLIEEFFGNMDACYISQFFYYDGSDEAGKIYAGPVWDYDLSMGNLWQMKNPRSLFASRLQANKDVSENWFYYLYQKEEFYDYVVQVYKSEFIPIIEQLLNNKLPGYAKQISCAVENDRIRWGISSEQILALETDVQVYLSERMAFLNSVWFEDAPYLLVCADSRTGINYVYHAVKPGDSLSSLPIFIEDNNDTFVGWYYLDTDEPIDPAQPIYEDVAIYAKWLSSSRMSYIDKLIPIVVVTFMFFGVLVVAITRIRKGG